MNRLKVDPIIYLSERDPLLGSIIKRVALPLLESHIDFFRALVEDIISQQLSGKAADTITNRFNNLFPKLPYTPKQVLDLSTEKIRSVGISYAKVSYIKDLALHVKVR